MDKIKIHIVVPEAVECPKLYGLAYWDYASRAAHCYIIPLNWFVRWGRELWIVLRGGNSKIENKILEQGIQIGRELAIKELYYNKTLSALENQRKQWNNKNR